MTALLDRPIDIARTLHADAVADGLVRAVAYTDIFSFAPTVDEAHRYLVGVRASLDDVDAALGDRSGLLEGRLSLLDGHLSLPGREHLVAERDLRRAEVHKTWPVAVRYARAVGALPFVRMVAVTGALAAGNAVPGADIDLLVVTETGRLWLARAESIAIVRFAERRGHEVCPNYFLAESALALDDRDLYAAHELVQAIPITGPDVHRQMLAANPWTAALLPNAVVPHVPPMPDDLLRPLSAAAEALLRSPVGELVEAWERRRKVRRFRRLAAEAGSGNGEASFGPDRCKGHFEAHGARIRAAYEARCRAAGVDPLWKHAETVPRPGDEP